MKTEFRKLIVLPTPKWTIVAVLAPVLIATVAVAIFGPGQDHVALFAGLAVPTWIGSTVLGVWMAGLEYGQKTMRRTLTRNPNRIEVVATKIGVALLAAVALNIVATAVATPLFALASAGHQESMAVADTINAGLGSIANNIVYVIAGFSFGLITRSMAGGMAIALGYLFVVDSLLAQIPKVGDLMLGAVSAEIFAQIVGSEITPTDFEVNLGRAIVVSIIWVAVLVGASTLRFLKTDID